MYMSIINPRSGRNISIHSKLANAILNEQYGGYAEDLKSDQKCILWQRKYLDGVCINESNRCQNLCSIPNFTKTLFHPEAFYILNDVQEQINDLNIFTPVEHCNLLKKDWVTCKKNCFKTINQYISREIESTAYMLRLIHGSIIKTHGSVKLAFVYDGAKLNGLWEHDMTHFTLDNTDVADARLVMGFGPSASGKTYWARNILQIFRTVSEDFPKLFLSIDGGLQRELCESYQYVIQAVQNSNIGGLVNLVSAGMSMNKSLFKSSTVKKSLVKYLKTQSPISLYVPITLGGCIKNMCKKSYKDFIDITNDANWIGLMIYQHKTGIDCPYLDEYRCVGCTESGKKREMLEGKQYSNTAYKNSISNGHAALKNSQYCRILIHNTGGFKVGNTYAKSIITEYAVDGEYKLNSKLINKEYNCIYLRDGEPYSCSKK